MILKNSWGRYDRAWVIGDLNLTVNSDFHLESGSRAKGIVVYEGKKGIEEYLQNGDLSKFQKRVCSVLLKNIESGMESMTCLDLAMEYCMSAGMFKENYLSEQIEKYIDELKNMTEEKNGFRYLEMIELVGGDLNNITDEGMEFVKRNAYFRILIDHVVPEYVLHDDKTRAANDFIISLRMAVTSSILMNIFVEANV